jgi:hypothetical protein
MKKILKPTPYKIILSVLISVVCIPFVEIFRPIFCISNVSCPQSVPVTLLSLLVSVKGTKPIIGVSLGLLAGGYIISYLISCLFALITESFKNFRQYSGIRKSILITTTVVLIIILGFATLITNGPI